MQLKKDNFVRVVVVSGSGDKSFSTGADIKDFEKNRFDSTSAKKYAEEGVLIDSKVYSLFSHLAFISNELKEHKDAIAYANKSLAIKKKFGPALIELGRAYTFLCNKTAANEYFEQSKRYDRRLYSQNVKWSKDYITEKCKK